MKIAKAYLIVSLLSIVPTWAVQAEIIGDSLADFSGAQGMFIQNVQIGSTIDFAIDPLGTVPSQGSDGIYSARADGSIFSAVISTGVPEPAELLLISTGLICLVFARYRQHSNFL